MFSGRRVLTEHEKKNSDSSTARLAAVPRGTWGRFWHTVSVRKAMHQRPGGLTPFLELL